MCAFLELLLCLIMGIAGGTMFHWYWLMDIGRSNSGQAITSSREDISHRNRLWILAAAIGALAAFAVWLFYAADLSDREIEINKVATLSFVAGLSGQGLLGLLKSLVGLGR